MTEREYRKLNRVSYSSLKAFVDDRKQYYFDYENAYTTDDEDDGSTALRMGSIVDCLELEPEDFSNRFVVATVTKPTGQMGQFLDKLFIRTKESLSIDGRVTRSIESLTRQAYNDVAFDKNGERVAFKRKTWEQVVEEFDNGPGAEFYEQQRDSLDKKLIDPGDEEQANLILKVARESPRTKDLLGLKTGGKYRVINQLKYTFCLWRLDAKMMPDKIIINDEKRIVQPFDLKTAYDPENFMYNYLKYRYYIQACVYHYGIIDWMRNNDLEGYELKPMKFVVLDTNAFKEPLIYACTSDNLTQARDGFFDRGKHYKGVHELCLELGWHRENNNWKTSVDNEMNKGICPVKIFE